MATITAGSPTISATAFSAASRELRLKGSPELLSKIDPKMAVTRRTAPPIHSSLCSIGSPSVRITAGQTASPNPIMLANQARRCCLW